MRASSVTDVLLEDHRRLHELLARAVDAAGVNHDAYTELRRGLLRHIAIEEKLLFPAVKKATGTKPPWSYELRVEHAALTSLLVPTPDPALLRELGLLLSEHDAKEEGTTGVYAECDRVLGPHLVHELAARAGSFPPVPLAPNFDGRGVHRTRASALEAAARMRRPA